MTPGPHGTAFGGPGRLGRAARPLLLIDLMRAYSTPGVPFDLGSGPAVAAAARGCWRRPAPAGPGRLHTRSATPATADGGLFVRKVRRWPAGRGRPRRLGELRRRSSPRAAEVVIVKQYASAFFGTSLAATLTAAGVDTVVIAGVSTSGCVRASATDAMQHGFRPMVVARGLRATGRPAARRPTSPTCDAKYADVVALQEALEHLR